MTHAIGTADTGVTPNVSGAFTPALDDLLIAFVSSATTVDAAHPLSSSVGTTFTQITTAVKNASADRLYAYVADTLVASATSQTVTVSDAGDASAGTIIYVARVSGMRRLGPIAVRQSAIQSNGAAAGTPAPAFAVAALTENPCLGFVSNGTNPSTFTQPSGWTEGTADLGFATPTTGGEYAFINSGFTGTTVTWGSSSATAFGAIIIELDAAAVIPSLVTARRRT